jgi:hypothetical protein
MEYLIIEAGSREKLQGAVNNNIRNGWKLQGGISAFYNLSGYFYLQAMVKEAQ